MFKEAEKGDKEIFIERTEEALDTNAEVIVTACPFCMTMITDGLKYKNKEEEIKNLDIAELVAMSLNLWLLKLLIILLGIYAEKDMEEIIESCKRDCIRKNI